MIRVGIGEYAISNDQRKKIVTHSLGSCVAVIIRCPKSHQTAMAHIVLPNKAEKPVDQKRLANYADMFLPELINRFVTYMTCHPRSMEVTLVGGADSARHDDLFQVGKKNLKVIKEILDQHHIVYNDQETGGRVSRTVAVSIKTGEIEIKKQKMIL